MRSRKVPPPPLEVAVLDACVLYPPLIRDLFLWLAFKKVFQPKWTEAIHTEWIENLLENRPDLSRDKLLHTRDLMNQNAGDCLVHGWETTVGMVTLPDANDRHVLAAAIIAQAQTIVTFNLRDFPASVLAPYNVTAAAPDDFLCALYDVKPQEVVSAARAMRQALKNPSKSRDEYLDGLRANRLTRFAGIMEAQL